MTLVNWYGWDFFILILIMEESMINYFDLDEKGRMRPNGLIFDKRGCLWPTGLILTKGVSATNWICLDKRVSTINWLDLEKNEHLRPTGLVLTKGRLWSTDLILTKRIICDQLAWSWQKGVCDQLAWSWQKGAFVTNWLDLDKKEHLRSIAFIFDKRGCLQPTSLILTKRSVCDQLAWSWQKGVSATNWLILTKGCLGLLTLETKLLHAKIKIWNYFLTDKGFAFPLLFEMWSLSWFELYQEKFNWQKKFSFEKHLIFKILKFWNFDFDFWDFGKKFFFKSRV